MTDSANSAGQGNDLPKDAWDKFFAWTGRAREALAKRKEAKAQADGVGVPTAAHDGQDTPECYRMAGVSPPLIPDTDNFKQGMLDMLEELERDLEKTFDDRYPDKGKVDHACRLLCDRMLRFTGQEKTVLSILKQKHSELYDEACMESIRYYAWK